MKKTVKLLKAVQGSETSVDFVVEINGQKRELALRYVIDKDGNQKLTILKDADLWYVETDTFGYPIGD